MQARAFLKLFVLVAIAAFVESSKGGKRGSLSSSSLGNGPSARTYASGAQEVPVPVETDTSARLVLKFSVDFSYVYYDLDGKLHVHSQDFPTEVEYLHLLTYYSEFNSV